MISIVSLKKLEITLKNMNFLQECKGGLDSQSHPVDTPLDKYSIMLTTIHILDPLKTWKDTL